MFKYLRKTKGQSTLEYIMVILIIIGALLASSGYLKSAFSGRMKSSADEMGEQFNPGQTNATITTKSHSKTRDSYTAGVSSSRLLDEESTNITTNQKILNVDYQYWGK